MIFTPGNRNNHGPSACDRDSCYRSGSIYKRAIFAPASLSKAGYSGTTDKNPGNDHPELPICGITPTSVQEAAKIRMSSPAFNSSELILTENAIAWKPSESKFLSNNLFSSMINTGKMIAEN